MRRDLLTVFGAALLCFAGYWSADRWDARRVWYADEHVQRSQTQPGSGRSDAAQAAHDAGIRFSDVASEVGIDFSYYNGAEGNYYLMETTGGGMSVLDFDADGNPDIFFVNGCRLPADPSDRRFVSKLYRSRGSREAENVAALAGVELAAYGQGATSADFDNDGFADFCVTCYGQCVLFHNNGDGTFRDVSELSAVQSSLWTTSASFADLDHDGAPDLYICAYGEVPVDRPRLCGYGDRRLYCLPSVYPAQPDLLFRNQGDGTFAETSNDSGVYDDTGRGLGIAIADFDGNDTPDIFVANDTSENFLWVNQRNFRFQESALARGVALTGTGATMSGMGVACGDYDRNGWLDMCVTNFYQSRSTLYQNLGPGGFIDSADATGVGAASRDRLGFGTVFLDADRDGFPDLFVANGHINDTSFLGVPYRMRQQLLLNEGGHRFRDVSESAGPYFTRRLLGRGVAVVDYNNDGLPDVVVSHLLDPAALLINRTPNPGHWLGLESVGTRSNRDGTNAKVFVTTNGERRAYEFFAGGGYLSSSDKRMLIGLGEASEVESVVIRWPAGSEQELGRLDVDRYHVVRERGASGSRK